MEAETHVRHVDVGRGGVAELAELHPDRVLRVGQALELSAGSGVIARIEAHLGEGGVKSEAVESDDRPRRVVDRLVEDEPDAAAGRLRRGEDERRGPRVFSPHLVVDRSRGGRGLIEKRADADDRCEAGAEDNEVRVAGVRRKKPDLWRSR